VERLVAASAVAVHESTIDRLRTHVRRPCQRALPPVARVYVTLTKVLLFPTA
jgi:hypothetical protein